ncbi:hypothetical protein KIK06_14965 [Nocardiopsis sp. EMB25]|uniref:hypothetical protein n=1 Tax=Nocardiopsis sp. EMB25 TaxID=2835867 RepID=UPI00228476F5|nr:hypothetical protein [Nocardiopsis sp. EMB25]MCY9785183.1 hypothetical protein [Nocardiopsis sp. EMB25]
MDAYLGMWGTVVEGSHEGTVGHPDLDEYASGQALELTSAMLQGVVAIGEPVLNPQVVATELDDDPVTVRVEDCVDSSGWLVTDEGEPADVGERKRLVSASVVSTDHGWRVDDLWLEDYGSC